MDSRAENYDCLHRNEQYVLLPLALKYLHRSIHRRMIYVWGLGSWFRRTIHRLFEEFSYYIPQYVKYDDFVAHETLLKQMHHKVVCQALWLLTWLWVLFLFSFHSLCIPTWVSYREGIGSVAGGASGMQGLRQSWKEYMRDGIYWWQ